MCGIIGSFSDSDVSSSLYEGLVMLQHRGQDAAGMATAHQGRLFFHKRKGLVSQVFDRERLLKMPGSSGIGHCRYSTTGCADNEEEVQPFYVNSPYGISLVHNGNLLDTDHLRRDMKMQARRHINTLSDSEILLNILAHGLGLLGTSVAEKPLTLDIVFPVVTELKKKIRGGYAVIALIADGGMIVFRDPNGIRPLVWGERVSAEGKKEYLFASESIALDILGFQLVRDVAPGECIFINHLGEFYSQMPEVLAPHTPCLFEYIYLSRPDSVFEGISVYAARLAMGACLADNIKKNYSHLNINVVIPIPDSGRPAAIELAMRLGLSYREGFVKSWYVGRTFIMPDQQQRACSVRQKLNIIASEVVGKNVLLVDDSIVRGTTCQKVIAMARKAGARAVYFASASPPVRYPNIYGINMPTYKELLASSMNEQGIADYIGADGLIYQNMDDLCRVLSQENSSLHAFEDSCFTGEYITDRFAD